MDNTDKVRTYRLVAFGMDKKGLTPPREPISHRNFSLCFEPFDSPRRLNEYDGAIIFQGIFESFLTKDHWEGRRMHGSYNKRELDKRVKEVDLLLQNGGFVCFVLSEPFIDQIDRADFSTADLAKIYSRYRDFYRSNYTERVRSGLKPLRNEFLRFLETYGAACSYFRNLNKALSWRIIAKVRGQVVSFILWDQLVFVPVILPDNREELIEEFCSLLCEALTSFINKLQVEIPAWVDEFKFEHEKSLISARQEAQNKVAEIDKQLAELGKFKRIIVTSDDSLVDDVCYVLRNGFGLKVDDSDEGREDLRVIDDKGNSIVFIEVKGTNSGVKREYVNQTDSHRDGAQLPPEFPAVLLINTHIKNARTLEEKDQEVALEQVKHATLSNVLILRSLDLLQLLRLYRQERLSRGEFIGLLTKNVGWLRVRGDQAEILTGNPV